MCKNTLFFETHEVTSEFGCTLNGPPAEIGARGDRGIRVTTFHFFQKKQSKRAQQPSKEPIQKAALIRGSF
jgi:hypothetical protein